MNKNNEIDQIFSACLDEVLSGQSTVADCLKRYPDYAAEVEGLLLTSLSISKAVSITPPAGAKMRIRLALNERMAEMSARKTNSRPFWRLGWANAVITFVLGLSLAGGSVAYAASGAMPDQALYPLKLDLEQALVSVTFASDAKVQLYAALNDRRVGEIVYLARKGDSIGIAEVTSRIETNLTAAAVAKGLSANEYAAAKAAGLSPSTPGTMGGTDTASAATIPSTSGLGTAVPPGTAQSPATTVTSPGNPPEVNTPSFGTNGLPILPKGGSELDASLLDHANNQISSLTGVSSVNNSLAVQSAIDRALAAIRSGYDALILEP